MKLLAVETATEACSAALYVDGVVTSVLINTQGTHAADFADDRRLAG